MPTSVNLIPIRVDVEGEGGRFKDSFCWDAEDPVEAMGPFVKKLLKDEKLPSSLSPLILQSIQSQVSDFRASEGQELSTQEKLVPLKLEVRVGNIFIRDQFLWDIGNMNSDPEEFAKTLCKDLLIEEPMAPAAVAIAIREQLLELARQSMTAGGRESRFSKKSRRGTADVAASNLRQGATAVALMRTSNGRPNVYRRKLEWKLFEPTVDILSQKEIEALDLREERNAK